MPEETWGSIKDVYCLPGETFEEACFRMYGIPTRDMVIQRESFILAEAKKDMNKSPLMEMHERIMELDKLAKHPMQGLSFDEDNLDELHGALDQIKAYTKDKTDVMNGTNKRKEVLDEAIKCVTKDRNAAYGSPEDNFQHIADLWNAQFKLRRGDFTFSPFDVAIMFVLMKVARTRTSPDKLDNLVDLAGYAACAADCIPKKGED